ncbi:MAG: aminotransferase class I/II-fold pyridoxal phosphate-dependent enzyme [Phycisphaerae bacterium]|nr:aminotransferase class I/II-fold pyridoxal phosphate-dependent enzyme [Gemmatimonadaceae bacterium]
MNDTPLLPDDAQAAGIQSLVDMLEYRAHQHPTQTAFRYLGSDGNEKQTITFAQLQHRARAVAAQLVERTVPGDRVMLLIPPGLDYIAAFFGCVYAGTMAVPAYPPNPRRADPRVARMVADCGARVALVTAPFIARLDDWLQHSPELRALAWLDVERLQQSDASLWRTPSLTKTSLAMLQYTSGSTGDPRGVMLTHGNLLHNLAVIHRVSAHREGDNAVFWLPPFHDMGLIGGILQPIYAKVPTALMAPASFLQQPVLWLKAIARYRATTSGAPNFAYALCVERIAAEERETLDLSSWRTSFNGAEPIHADTISRFVAAFRESGLRPDVMLPCYGLAEATLLVSGGPVQSRFRTRIADRARLEAGDFKEVNAEHANAVALVASGSPVASVTVRVVDPDTSVACEPGVVGEIWVSGESVAAGYWNQKDATAATFHATVLHDDKPYLRTGDLGVLTDGDLIVTGRIKDLVILDGRNYYPHDIEVAAERSHPGLRVGHSAAFSVPGVWREQLVFVAEVSRRHSPDQNAELFQAVRTELAGTVGVVPHEIVLISHHSMPRTSSGKVQRRACRAAYLGETLDVVARWQTPGTDVAPAAVAITAYLIDWVVDELQLDASRLNARTSLRDVGLDSLAATRLLVALEAKLGRRIEQVQLWEQPDIGALAEHLASHNSLRLPVRDARPEYGVPTAASTDIKQWAEYGALRGRLNELTHAEVENPFFQVHEGVSGNTTIIGGRTLINFASYNYLGLSGHPVVTRATQEAVARWGSSVSASRVVSGERPVHRTLERELARFVGVDDALVFIGGHPANVSTITHLMGTDDVVLCDARLHNSGMQGAEFSSARRLVFPHNDWQALDRMLARVRSQHRRALVVIEGVYSADGDIPDLARFVEVKNRHHAMLMVDEAHSLGVIGATGRGIAEHCGVPPRDVDVWMGTLSKSLASCGGYIAGSSALIEYLRYTAPGFVYSVGITPANAAAALAALRVLQGEPERVTTLHERARLFLSLCQEEGLDTGDSVNSAVIPVIVGDSLRAMQLSQQLFHCGINVQPMVAPAVPDSAARLRFFIACTHEPQQLRHAVKELVGAMRLTHAPTAAL